MFPRPIYFALLTIFLCFAETTALAQSRSNSATNAHASILDAIPTTHKHLVNQIIHKPTLSATYTEDPFQAHPNVYAWMLEHPDRVSLAWRRMKVPCLEITALADGSFAWTDPDGSQLIWQVVAKQADGVVWYASGKVKPAALLPMVTVKAVAIVKFTGKPTADKGIETLTPEASVYLLSESRAANVVLRMVGPAAPKMAKDGAEQMLFFFSGIAAHLRKHPDQVPKLLAAPTK